MRVARVAKSAKVSIPLIYKYFGDRDGLLVETLGEQYRANATADIVAAQAWLKSHPNIKLTPNDVTQLFPSPSDRRVRVRRIETLRIIVAGLEIPQLKKKLVRVHREIDRQFDDIIVEVQSRLAGAHQPVNVMRTAIRGLTISHVFGEFNPGGVPSDDEWKNFIEILVSAS